MRRTSESVGFCYSTSESVNSKPRPNPEIQNHIRFITSLDESTLYSWYDVFPSTSIHSGVSAYCEPYCCWRVEPVYANHISSGSDLNVVLIHAVSEFFSVKYFKFYLDEVSERNFTSLRCRAQFVGHFSQDLKQFSCIAPLSSQHGFFFHITYSIRRCCEQF